MKQLLVITSIAISLILLSSGCQTPLPNTTPTDQNAQNTEAPSVASQAPTETPAEPTPTNQNDTAVQTQTAQESASTSEYVDIADWCRPNMTEPIDAKAWAKANNAFGLNFLRQTQKNVVFSPYSIERALGMTLDGACLTTASEMLTALGLPNAKRLSMAGRDVDDAMKSVNADTMLEIENTLWPDVSMSLPADYLARISAGYRNKSISLDYSADPEAARKTINDDIAKTTHDRILDLIPQGNITPDTRLVLTNAVYFKSKWLHSFDEEYTKEEDFYNSDKKIKTKIMHTDGGSKRVCIAKDYAIYDMEFDSSKDDSDTGSYVMRIVLPTIDDAHPMSTRMKQLSLVEKQLSADFTSNCQNMTYDKVKVSMPKFSITYGTESIKGNLLSLGMRRAFTEDAEFFAMPNTAAKINDPSSYLMISDVLHKAFIEIDEKGGEAAAATAVVMVKASTSRHEVPPRYYYFTVDHPFLYMIIEKSTGAAIFMGRVTDL